MLDDGRRRERLRPLGGGEVRIPLLALRGAGALATTLYVSELMLRAASATSAPAMSSTWILLTGFSDVEAVRRCASKSDRPGP